MKPDEEFDRPSADSMSIPSSVDPDADSLGECTECGARSRQAYSTGLCPDCSEGRISPVSGDPMEYELYLVPTEVVWRHQPRSALYQDYEDKLAVEYRPLKKVNESEWLISVSGRVYVAPERMLIEGLGELE